MALLYEEYSPWKGVHFIERLKSVKNGDMCPPVSLQLGLTNKCSSKCYYCYVKEQNKLGETLETEAVIKLLIEAKELGVKAVEITGGGEPTVHPNFEQIVEKISELDLELGLVTNGRNINPDILEFATWVRVSIDSFDPTIYRQIRGVDMLDLEPIKQLCKYSNVVVGASCVITPYNYKGLYEFAATAKNIGFKNVWFKPVEISEDPKSLKPYLGICKSEINKSLELSDTNFKVFSPNFQTNIQADFTKSFPICMQQHLATFVWANGDIYPCCSLQGYSKTVVGNIYNGSFKEQWNQRKVLAVENCPINCFWTDKNMFMNYVLADNPQHVNFV